MQCRRERTKFNGDAGNAWHAGTGADSNTYAGPCSDSSSTDESDSDTSCYFASYLSYRLSSGKSTGSYIADHCSSRDASDVSNAGC